MADVIAFLQQQWELSLAFVLVLGYWVITEALTFSRGRGISSAQVVHFINRESATVIDLRPVEAFQHGHILNALSFPQAQLLSQLEKLKKHQEKPLILVDDNGLHASKFIKKLNQAGFAHCYYLKNGMQAWTQAHLPLHKD